MTTDYIDKLLIVTGGSLDIDWAKSFLQDNHYDYIIAADSGLSHIKNLGLVPNFILGDYDSVDPEVLEYFKGFDIKTYPREKDYTDTHLALITAIKLSPRHITILGATGSRLDHSLTSIGNLKALLDLDISAEIVDPHNKIYLVAEGEKHIIRKSEQYGDYVSLQPLGDKMLISLEGFYYPLEKCEVKTGLSLTQSNEISADEGVITVHEGIAIVVEARD
jgi:thiamine pyrophosphokinase